MPPGTPVKADLRSQLRARRERIHADEHARRSDQIMQRLYELPEIKHAACVHVFWPMLERREVDTRPLIAWLYTHKKQIVLPVVVTESGEAGGVVLEHRLFTGEDALVRSRWGIHEPQGSEPVSPDALDAVIVPALGVDRTGNRIGYGRGHYDRFLSGRTVPTICPVFEMCLLQSAPAESHDVPVDVVVTESEVIRTLRRNNGQGRPV